MFEDDAQTVSCDVITFCFDVIKSLKKFEDDAQTVSRDVITF